MYTKIKDGEKEIKWNERADIVKIDKKEAQKLGNIMYRHRVKWALQ